MQQPARRVGAQLRLQVSRQAEAAVQIAVSGRPGAVVTEELTIRQSGRDVALREVAMAGEGRVHLARLVPGAAEITYQAQVLGSTGPAPVTDADRLRYLRPSRYAESDRLAAVARAEFASRRVLTCCPRCRPGWEPASPTCRAAAGRRTALSRHC